MRVVRDLPDIADLMALADDAPRREKALVQRCHDIAARERRHGTEPYAAIAAGLAALCGGPAGAGLLAHVAAEIGAGNFDAPGPERARLEKLLWRFVLLKLHENNPEFTR
jgi:hypothetical protein